MEQVGCESDEAEAHRALARGVVHIELEYIESYYYFEGWELDMAYSYQLISKEETDYWKEEIK